jgi:hypothetical protein
MAPSKINFGAQWMAAEDRQLGVLRVCRGHRSLGTTSRIPLPDGLQNAFTTYQLLESGAGMREAVRLLMVVA